MTWLRRGVLGATLLLAPFLPAQTVLTFSDLPSSYFFNNGGQNIGSYYAGYTFGPNVTGLSVSRFGGYNSAAYPPHSGDVAIWDASDPAITITLATPAQSVGVWYASLGTITLHAFDKNNAPAGSATGNPNSDGVSGTSSFLSVSGSAISSVTFAGVPGSFVLSSLTLNGGGGNCTYSLSQTSLSVSASSGSSSVNITTGSGCAWTATSNASWLTITSGASGSGNGTVAFSIAANTGPARTGTLTIAGSTFTVSQAGTTSVSGLRFNPVTPCRIADTRNPAGPFGGPAISGGTSRSFSILESACNIPSLAQAYALNITVVPHGPLGYLSIWPSGQPQPVVSTLNSLDGRIKANAVLVPGGSGGAVSVFVTGDADVILDITGYFYNGVTSLHFFPLPPCRVADTRNSVSQLGGPRMTAGQTRSFPALSSNCGIPSTAAALSMNVTAVPQGPLGYLAVWPSGSPQPLVSTLNAPTGAITANAAIVPVGSGGAVSVFVTDPGDVIIDVNGYFAPGGSAPNPLLFYPATPCRVADTRDPAGSFGGPSLSAGQARSFPVSSSSCGLAAGSKAYALNVTVLPQGLLGYLSIWPGGATQPVVSTLNSIDGTLVANAAIVPSAADGSINVFVSNPADVILDSSGYFAP